MSLHLPSNYSSTPFTLLDRHEFDLQRKRILDQSTDLSLNDTLQPQKNTSSNPETSYFQRKLSEYELYIENLEDQIRKYRFRLETTESDIKNLEDINKKAFLTNTKLQNLLITFENREKEYQAQILQYKSLATNSTEPDKASSTVHRHRRTSHSFHMLEPQQRKEDKAQTLIQKLEGQVKYLQGQIDKGQLNQDFLSRKLDRMETRESAELNRLRKLEITMLTILNAGDEEELLRVAVEYKNYQNLTSKFLNSLAGIIQKIFPEARTKPNLKEMWSYLKKILMNYKVNNMEDLDSLDMVKKLVDVYDNRELIECLGSWRVEREVVGEVLEKVRRVFGMEREMRVEDVNRELDKVIQHNDEYDVCIN